MTDPAIKQIDNNFNGNLQRTQTLQGSDRNNTIEVQAPQGGTVAGGGGNDRIQVRGANNIQAGQNEAALRIIGEEGNDQIDVEASDNSGEIRIAGNEGDDNVTFKGDGNRNVRIGMLEGNNSTTLQGDRNNFRVYVGNGNNTVNLDKGSDGNVLGIVADERNGNSNLNVNVGGDGNLVYGQTGGGKDKINVTGNGNLAVLDTGAGDDEYSVSGRNNGSLLNLGAGNDKLKVKGTGNLTIAATGEGNDEVDIQGNQNFTGVDTGAGNDKVHAGGAGNVTGVNTGDGDDEVKVDGSGNTTYVDTGAGNDKVTVSGNGNTTHVVTNEGDTVTLEGEGWKEGEKQADGTRTFTRTETDADGNETTSTVTVTGDGEVVYSKPEDTDNDNDNGDVNGNDDTVPPTNEEEQMDELDGNNNGNTDNDNGNTNNDVAAQQQNIQHLEQNFEKVDTNKDGILTNEEISAYDQTNEGDFSKVTENSHELMFANIDPGNAAWHGLSKNDLGTINYRLSKGESLDQIGDDLRNQYGRSRGAGTSDAQFRAYVEQQRGLHPLDKSASKPTQEQLQKDVQGLVQPDNFAQYDKNDDGYLSEAELKAISNNQGAMLIAQYNRELIFGNIDAGNKAWGGLSLLDIQYLNQQMQAGKSIEQVAADLRAKIAQERNQASDESGFRAYVDNTRRQLGITE